MYRVETTDKSSLQIGVYVPNMLIDDVLACILKLQPQKPWELQNTQVGNPALHSSASHALLDSPHLQSPCPAPCVVILMSLTFHAGACRPSSGACWRCAVGGARSACCSAT